MPAEPITFVTATNDRAILENNFLASPCLAAGSPYQILIQEGFPSASLAYNDAIDKSENDLMVFAHQDILFPARWVDDLRRALKQLELTDPNWGVLGCYGETLNDHGRGYILSGVQGILGKPFPHPERVQTLDEIVLILRKSSRLRFDAGLPHFHFYGTDICMEAASQGRVSYAISAFCIHNAAQTVLLPREFYQCRRYIKAKWFRNLPIQTTVTRVTRWDWTMQKRRVLEFYLRHVEKKVNGLYRMPDGRALLLQYEQTDTANFAKESKLACPAASSARSCVELKS